MVGIKLRMVNIQRIIHDHNNWLIVGIKIIFDLMFIYGLPKVWDDYRLYVNQDELRYLISWIAYFALVCLVKSRFLRSEFSSYDMTNYILLLLGIFSVLPGICMYGMGSFTDQYFVFFVIFWIMLLLCLNILEQSLFSIFKMIKGINVVNNRVKIRLMGLIFLIFASVLVWIYFNYNISLITYSIFSTEIYEQRAYFAASEKPKWLNYVIGNMWVVLYLCFGYFLNNKKYILIVVSIFFVYMNFSLNGSKSVLFGLLTFIVGYYGWTLLTLKRFFLFIFISTTVILVALGIHSDLGYYAASFSYRRVLADPAFISSCYFDFFINNGATIVSKINIYQNLENIIGEKYYYNPLMSCNNGLMGEAVAMWGIWGCFIQPVVVAAFVTALNIASGSVSQRIKFGLSCIIVMTLVNTFLRTSMLSHGFILLIVMLFLFPQTDDSGRGENNETMSIS